MYCFTSALQMALELNGVKTVIDYNIYFIKTWFSKAVIQITFMFILQSQTSLMFPEDINLCCTFIECIQFAVTYQS